MTDTVEGIINAQFSHMKQPKDERLERAEETWRPLNRKKTLVALPKVPDNYVEAEVYNHGTGANRDWSEAYHATLEHLRHGGARQVGVIDALTTMADLVEQTKVKSPSRKPRHWQKNTEEE